MLGWGGRYLGWKISHLEGGPYLLQSHWLHLHVDKFIGSIINHNNVLSEDRKPSNSPSSTTRKMLLEELVGDALHLPEVLRHLMAPPLE